ncbi:hypothetical protein BMR85_008055 [Achromobacter sp. KAs 3-5]|nr:hypothetical protein BMR85_008055 [Achromobacter sp. KAs 3-5]
MRGAHRRTVCQRFGHQRIELRIAVAFPPLRGGPFGGLPGQPEFGGVKLGDGLWRRLHQRATGEGEHQCDR